MSCRHSSRRTLLSLNLTRRRVVFLEPLLIPVSFPFISFFFCRLPNVTLAFACGADAAIAQLLLMLQREAALVEEMRTAAAEFRKVHAPPALRLVWLDGLPLCSVLMNRCNHFKRRAMSFIAPVLRSCHPP